MSRKKRKQASRSGNTTDRVSEKRKGMIPLWKFYVPFITVALILFGKYYYAIEGLIYHHIFPMSKGGLAGFIFIILMGFFFILLFARRYYWRKELDEKWYDFKYGIGIGLWLSFLPAIFLTNTCFSFILWMNSLHCTPSYEQRYLVRKVEIIEKSRPSTMRYSANVFIHSFPYAELKIESMDVPSEFKYAYCDKAHGMSMADMDSVLLLVRQQSGWLGFDIVNKISVDMSKAKKHNVTEQGSKAEESRPKTNRRCEQQKQRAMEKLQEMLDKLEQKNKRDTVLG